MSPLPRKEIRDRLVEMTVKSSIRDAYVIMIVTRGLRFVRQYTPEECENFCCLMVMPYLWVMDEATQKAGGSAVITRTVRHQAPSTLPSRTCNGAISPGA